jgi:hypothetical protein
MREGASEEAKVLRCLVPSPDVSIKWHRAVDADTICLDRLLGPPRVSGLLQRRERPSDSAQREKKLATRLRLGPKLEGGYRGKRKTAGWGSQDPCVDCVLGCCGDSRKVQKEKQSGRIEAGACRDAIGLNVEILFLIRSGNQALRQKVVVRM